MFGLVARLRSPNNCRWINLNDKFATLALHFLTSFPVADTGFLGVVARYRIPERTEDRLVSGTYFEDWYIRQAIDLKLGLECCSKGSLSFHYVDAQLMRRLYSLVYSCPKIG